MVLAFDLDEVARETTASWHDLDSLERLSEELGSGYSLMTIEH